MGFDYSALRMKTTQKSKAKIDRYKFSRTGEVVRDRRRVTATFDTEAYRSGDPIYAPRASSPAREKFHAESNARRLASKGRTQVS